MILVPDSRLTGLLPCFEAAVEGDKSRLERGYRTLYLPPSEGNQAYL